MNHESRGEELETCHLDSMGNNGSFRQYKWQKCIALVFRACCITMTYYSTESGIPYDWNLNGRAAES